MNNLSQKIWTKQLTADTITIDSSYDIVILSFTLMSGTGTYIGSAQAGGMPSSAVNLVVGQAVTISSDGTLPIDGFTITTTGVLAIIGKQ